MNIVLRIGTWIEKRFPEKIAASEVYADIRNSKIQLSAHEGELKNHYERISSLEKLHEDFKKIKEDLNIIKTQSIIKSRIVGDNMTPFATRMQPVKPAQPTSGGNGQ